METKLNKRYPLEVADIIRYSRAELEQSRRLCAVQLKAMDAIESCRTVDAGGHLNRCNACGHQQPSYNSCRNRHCPKCQYIKQEQWVDKLKGRLIPGRYFHLVFTLPQELHPLYYINPEGCYDLLFQAAWEALQNAGRNPAFLGADVGAVAVLHTWGQTLTYHPHVHLVVPAGGLSEDQVEWIRSPKKFFVPVKALSVMFRGIFVRYLRKLLDEKKLKLPKGFTGFLPLKEQLYQKNWNVYSKKAFGGMNSVLDYLGRYTHRVAITNNRLISMDNGKVVFRYRNYRKGNQQGCMQLEAVEFSRRFLQHILPSGFHKIRYFGLLATAHIHTKREQAISLVGKTIWLPQLEGLTAYEVLYLLTGRDPMRCPLCKKGLMMRIRGLRQVE